MVTVQQLLTGTRRRLSRQWGEPVYRAGYLLVVNSVLSAVTGMTFWLLAARVYPPAVVGSNSSALFAMTFLAGLSQLNLTNALLRFLPTTSGARTRRMVSGVLLTVSAVAIAAAIVFLLGLGRWAPGLVPLFQKWPLDVLFVGGTAVSTLLLLQTAALVALGRAAAATTANQVFGWLKLGLLFVCVRLLPSSGVMVAWILATGVALAGGLVFLARTALPEFDRSTTRALDSAPPTRRDLLRFVGPDYVASLSWIASTSLVPLIVLNLTDASHAAVFGLAWSMCLVLYGVPAALGQSLIAHGARDLSKVGHHHRHILGSCLLVLTPVVAVLVVGAPLVLRLFGPWYAAGGTSTLRLLSLSTLPNAVVALAVSRARARRDMRTVVASMVTLLVLVLGLSLYLVPRVGIAGGGMAWLLGECVVAAAIGARALRPSAVMRWVRSLGVPVRARLLPALRVGRLHLPPASDSDTTVFPVSSGDGPALLKVATTGTGSSSLEREREVLLRLAGRAELGAWRDLLPPVLALSGTAPDRLALGRITGSSGLSVPGDGQWQLARAAFTAMEPLHLLDLECRPTGDALLEEWVDRPVERVHLALPPREGLDAALDRLAARLRRQLEGRWLCAGWCHGDFWPGAVVVDQGQVRGIVDWAHASDHDLPVLDRLHWLLAMPVRGHAGSVAQEVARRLHGREAPTPEECELLEAAPGGLQLQWHTLLQLAWLRHMDSTLRKAGRHAPRSLWLQRDVVPVLSSVGGD